MSTHFNHNSFPDFVQRGMQVSHKATVALTFDADQWSLTYNWPTDAAIYAASGRTPTATKAGAEIAAVRLNEHLEELINTPQMKFTPRREDVAKAMLAFMGNPAFSDYGALDSESRRHLTYVLDMVYGRK